MDFAVPLLITSFAAQHQQNLAAAVLVPVGSGSRLKGNIGQGRIPGRVVGTETGQISLSGKKTAVRIGFSLFKIVSIEAFFISAAFPEIE